MTFMRGSIINSGYRNTSKRHDGKLYRYLYHRFIFECNYGPIPDGFVIDHMDNDKLNYNKDNLQVISQSANIKKN